MAIPDPPELDAQDPNEYDDAEIVGTTDYRREELEEFLRDGAWEKAWKRWEDDIELSDVEMNIITDLELFQKFDFFWDSFADRVGYHAPGLPEDWRERDIHPELDSWGKVSSINAGLTELGQVVSEVLKEEYINWEAEYEPPDDLPDFGE